MISNISIEELLKINNPNIIDIRSMQSFNNNHITGAINIPYEKLLVNPCKYLEKTRKYYLYCQKGITSIKICNILYRQGYSIININGGYEEWIMKKD